MSIENLQDENLRLFYENVREQVEADRGSRYKFASGTSVKQYATALREEMIRRQLQHLPIAWDESAEWPACRGEPESQKMK